MKVGAHSVRTKGSAMVVGCDVCRRPEKRRQWIFQSHKFQDSMYEKQNHNITNT